MANPHHSPRSGKFNRKTRAHRRSLVSKQPRNAKGKFTKKSRRSSRKATRRNRRR
jgi:hypothetical protein